MMLLCFKVNFVLKFILLPEYEGKTYVLRILYFGKDKKKLFVIERLHNMGLKILVDGIAIVKDVLPFGLRKPYMAFITKLLKRGIRLYS